MKVLRQDGGKKADIAPFPEMWSNGYHIYDRPVVEWTAEAISADSDFVNTFGRLAGELEMAVGITFLETFKGGPRNTLVLFDRFGERKLTYAKVHTCDFDVERKEGIYIADLNLRQLRDYRTVEVHGNAYRHPKRCGLLVDTKIESPFIRDDYREK